MLILKNWVGFFGCLLAFCAFLTWWLATDRPGIAAFWQAFSTIVLVCITWAYLNEVRESNRIARENLQNAQRSLRPVMYISFYYNADGAGYDLQSVGLGPAIVRWFEVQVDGIPQPHWRGVAQALELPNPRAHNFTVPHRGSILPPNESSRLFWVRSDSNNVKALRRAHSQNRVIMRICYCSFFQDCWLHTNISTESELSSCSVLPELEFRSNPL